MDLRTLKALLRELRANGVLAYSDGTISLTLRAEPAEVPRETAGTAPDIDLGPAEPEREERLDDPDGDGFPRINTISRIYKANARRGRE